MTDFFLLCYFFIFNITCFCLISCTCLNRHFKAFLIYLLCIFIIRPGGLWTPSCAPYAEPSLWWCSLQPEAVIPPGVDALQWMALTLTLIISDLQLSLGHISNLDFFFFFLVGFSWVTTAFSFMLSSTLCCILFYERCYIDKIGLH